MAENKNNVKPETMEFQAEVRKVLDIVINSLYTEKEIFVRELVSNSADALEKFRLESLTQKEYFDRDLPMEIYIELEEKANTFTIIDTGLGMTREEVIENLGTIAHSGSRLYQAAMADKSKEFNLIGQFGVGFYSVFMVAEKVRVLSRSYKTEAQGVEWVSDGVSGFTVSESKGIRRGTKIILELKKEAKEYSSADKIREIIKKYSNFVPYPILVKGEKVNTIQAIWAASKKDIKEEEYTEFYKYIANAFDEPLYRLHFSSDVPLAIQALLYVPKDHFERFGFGRIKSGVNLYCKKVLLEPGAKGILPEWLRFAKGVVDSEDLPLNISRQTLQDSTLVARLRKVVTTRFLKFLAEQADEDPKKYQEFYKNFANFIREGITTDRAYVDDLAKLVRFESSGEEAGNLVSLDAYVKRMGTDQKAIYYINGPSREAIQRGPYIEAFRLRDIEVLYTLDPVDDFVLTNLGKFNEKPLVSIDSADVELPSIKQAQEEKIKEKEQVIPLDREKVGKLTGFFKEVLGEKVSSVKESSRLVENPAILVNPDKTMTSSMQRYLQDRFRDEMEVPIPDLGNKVLEINPGHDVIKNLAEYIEIDREFAKVIVEQVFENALLAAGLMSDPRNMVDRIYKILGKVLEK